MASIACQLEHSVEADVSPAFAWSWRTDIKNWDDPPAQFQLDGPFVKGSWGTTRFPGQQPLRWQIRDVQPGKSFVIVMALDQAALSFEWLFEAVWDRRTRITQRIVLSGDNAAAYADQVRTGFGSNLPNGMKRIADAMVTAERSRTNPQTKETENMLLEGQPGPISIDPARTALLVIDMQNDFGAKGGIFERAGIDISQIQKVVPPTARVIAASRKAEIKVIYLKMGFRPDLSDAGPPDSPNWLKHSALHFGDAVQAPDGTESRMLVRDTWNTEILAELKPQPGDVIIWKNRFSGFYQTELDDVLKRLNVKHLIFTGCTTSVCVESTIRDATFRDYTPVLLSDCTAEPIGYGLPRTNHEASLLLIQVLFGWVSHSEHFVRALQSQTAPAARQA